MKLIIIRGLPGSGKSSLAKTLVSTVENSLHAEADMYFRINKDNRYIFQQNFLSEAHKYCKDRVCEAMECETDLIVVSNTFSRYCEYKYYINLAKKYCYEYQIIEVVGDPSWKSVHNIPSGIYERMLERWESTLTNS